MRHTGPKFSEYVVIHTHNPQSQVHLSFSDALTPSKLVFVQMTKHFAEFSYSCIEVAFMLQ